MISEITFTASEIWLQVQEFIELGPYEMDEYSSMIFIYSKDFWACELIETVVLFSCIYEPKHLVP